MVNLEKEEPIKYEETSETKDIPEAEPQENTEDQSKKHDKQLYWILGVMVILIIVFLGSSYIFKSFSKFEYQGMTFTKEKFGEIPLFKYSYYVSITAPTGSVVGNPPIVNLYLLEDPRKNNVPVEGEIALEKKRPVYVSIDPNNLTQCEYTLSSIGSLSMFLSGNKFKVESASPNQTLANETQAVYATCETHPKNSVILIKQGEETKITQTTTNCYEITVNDCGILQAIEKFEVQSIIDAKARQTN